MSVSGRSHAWAQAARKFIHPLIHYQKALKDFIKQSSYRPVQFPTSFLLSEKQKEVYDRFVKLSDNILDDDFVAYNICLGGASGSGKSIVLQSVRKLLIEKNIPHVYTTTCGSLAAYHDFYTLHSVLGIPKFKLRKSWYELKKEGFVSSPVLTRNLKYCRIFFIDEYSLLQPGCLSYLDFVLRRVRGIDAPFSNTVICCCGDFYQVKAIGRSLISEIGFTDEESSFSQLGIELFRSFSYNYFLETSERHSSDIEFLKLLINIRGKVLSESDIKALESRLVKNLSDSEVEEFDDAILVCQTNKVFRKYNLLKLHEFSSDVLRVKTKVSVSKLYSPDFDLHVALGCKVVSTLNHSVRNRLVNGSSGILKAVLFNKSRKPVCLMVKFDGLFCPGVEGGCFLIFETTDCIGFSSEKQTILVTSFPNFIELCNYYL